MWNPRGWKGLLILLQWQKLLLSLGLLSGCCGHKPQLFPNVTELQIHEGETLKITCTSIGYVYFHHPVSNILEMKITSTYDISPIGKSKKKTFIRSSTVFGDTGWYGCVDENKKITDMSYKDYNDPSISWIYVYVKSNRSAFVRVCEHWDALEGFGCNGFAIIPCQTTAPDFNVTLKNANNTVLKPSENITFDPKIGYVIKNLRVLDLDLYICEVNQNNFSQKFRARTFYTKKDCVSKPIIEIGNAEKVTTGSTLNVKCMFKIRREALYSISWNIPRNSSFRRVLEPIPEEVVNWQDRFNLITSTLILDNITTNDSGDYVCQVRSSFNENESSNIYIRVHNNARNEYINLMSNNNRRYGMLGKSVTFVAYFDAYPTPKCTWFDNNAEKIFSFYTYRIINTAWTCSLIINDVRHKHKGIYMLEAKNTAGVRQLNFSIEKVIVPPKVQFDTANLKSYYSFNESTSFICLANSDPKSDISWIYKNYSEWRFKDNYKPLELQGTETDMQTNNTLTKSTLTINLQEESGTINCTACNTYACNYAVKSIHITDGPSNASYGIIRPKTELLIGNNVTLVCAAVIREFSSAVWLDDKRREIINTKRINVLMEKTMFTYLAILSINNVNQSDVKDYYCKATPYVGKPKIESFSLEVKVPT